MALTEMTGNSGGAGESSRSTPPPNRIPAKESSDEVASCSATGACGWGVVSASVCVAIHERSNGQNQDALKWWLAEEERLLAVLCVADGHGGSEYKRSREGACCAVKEAKKLLADEILPHILDNSTGRDWTQFDRQVRQRLPKDLVNRWRKSIEEHAKRNPISKDETSHSDGEANDQPDTTSLDSSDAQLYGTTILAALLTPEFHIYIQLGDGDVLTVTAEGEVVRPPFPVDSHLLANHTTSLCSKEAWRFVRIHFQPIFDRPPVFVMLATDGYANSFADETDFKKVAKDLYNAIQQDGPEAVASQLPDWLEATSKGGSGDDISVVIAANIS